MIDNPTVSRLQIERYRQMTGEQRLEIGLRMWEFARDWIANAIRIERPQISDVGTPGAPTGGASVGLKVNDAPLAATSVSLHVANSGGSNNG